MQCEQMLEHDALIEAKELELASLHTQLAASEPQGESFDLSN